jgi:Phage gp6-like head-tail connector protein
MATGDLTTLTNVKSWLGLTGTSDDTLLTRLITAESIHIQSYLYRTIAATAYTETRDGPDNDRLALANWPINSVSLVKIDDVIVPASTDLVASQGYSFTERFIELSGYWFTKGRGNVVVTYNAGYATTPFDLEQACIELVVRRYRERDRIGAKSKSVGGETISYDTAAFPDSVKEILQTYKKVIPL